MVASKIAADTKGQLNSDEVIVSPKMQTKTSTLQIWILAIKNTYTHQKIPQKVLQSMLK